MAEQKYTVGGFSFADEQMAAQAGKELEGIKYVRSRIDMENPEVTLEVYRKMLEEELFETPVGLCFLKEVQESLRADPRIRGEEIADIPIERTLAVKAKKEPEPPKEQTEKEPKKQVRLIEKHINYKRRYGMLLSVSIVLVIIVAAMFAITLTNNSPNILNYENEIINKYEDWERQLKEKEEELEQREAGIEQRSDTYQDQSSDSEQGIIGL